jgi:hypothetical protein
MFVMSWYISAHGHILAGAVGRDYRHDGTPPKLGAGGRGRRGTEKDWP